MKGKIGFGSRMWSLCFGFYLIELRKNLGFIGLVAVIAIFIFGVIIIFIYIIFSREFISRINP